ncbi:Protease 2 [Rickettsiales bacterium Ac37b]|nr:Protease 2 [Rickettsiales bacterium Ac37b]
MDYDQGYLMAINNITEQQVIAKFAQEENKIFPPIPKKIPHIYNYHNEKVVDNYYWLRDANWPDVSNSRILNYIEQENLYTSYVMKPYKKREDSLFEEITSRIKLDDVSVAVKKDNYFYYSKTEKDSNHSIICRKKETLDAAEEVLLDANELAKGLEYFNLGGAAVTPDHKKLAYSTDIIGAERYTIVLKNLSDHKFLNDTIINTTGNIVWHENGIGFFYEKLNEQWRSQEIYYHKLGTDTTTDKLIFKEEDTRFSVSVGRSSDKEYIFIDTHSADSNETWFIKMNDKTMTPKLILARKDDQLYEVDHGNELFYLRINDHGKNFRLITNNNTDFKQNTWQELIPFNPKIYLTGFALYKGYVAIEFIQEGLDQIKIIDMHTRNEKAIAFKDPTYDAGIMFTTYDATALRYGYSSLNTPSSVMEYDFATDSITVLKEQEVLGGYNKDLYKSERIFAVAQDGTKIPISLVYKKELFKKDGSNPLYLYGYGSYGISISPNFSTQRLSLLDRGFVYAIAHIRGGDDMGYDWYEAGKLLNKKNSFSDFIDVTEHLIKHNYSHKQNIVIAGGSAGGMLMGVCANEWPDLYKAVIMHVPFVDVLNTMYDENLPLTPGEFKEWGNPKDLAYYEYIKSYSPYDNVKTQSYPAMYVTCGISDPRVTYWEAAKWVAKLREMKQDTNLLLLETKMDAGHKGASGRFGYYRDVAKEYNFILKIFGIE